MTKAKRCPACKSDVDADAEHCPNCPHSFVQFEGHERGKKHFGPSSWHPVIWVLVVMVLFLGAYRLIDFFITAADPDSKDSALKTFVDNQKITVVNTKGGRTVVSAGKPDPDEKDDKSPAAASGSEQASAAAPAQAENEPVYVSAAPEAASAPAPKEWRLRGVVYDLVTLQPIPDCAVVFFDADTQSRYETSTDESGLYRTTVPPLTDKGYIVTFKKPGYAHSYLNPGTENVQQMPPEDRRSTAAELAKSIDSPYEVQAADAAPLKTDFYLAPTNPN